MKISRVTRLGKLETWFILSVKTLRGGWFRDGWRFGPAKNSCDGFFVELMMLKTRRWEFIFKGWEYRLDVEKKDLILKPETHRWSHIHGEKKVLHKQKEYRLQWRARYIIMVKWEERENRLSCIRAWLYRSLYLLYRSLFPSLPLPLFSLSLSLCLSLLATWMLSSSNSKEGLQGYRVHGSDVIYASLFAHDRSSSPPRSMSPR